METVQEIKEKVKRTVINIFTEIRKDIVSIKQEQKNKQNEKGLLKLKI